MDTAKSVNAVSPLDLLLDNWVPSSLVLKTTNVCTFKCKYCFWFRNKAVLNLPDYLSEDIEDALVQRIETYGLQNSLKKFEVIFHGGEPLLWPLYRYESFIKKMNAVTKNTECIFRYNIQTNGSLINDLYFNNKLTDYLSQYQRLLLPFSSPRASPDIDLILSLSKHHQN